VEPEVEYEIPERVRGNHPINSITTVETPKTVSHLSDKRLTMIDLIELIGSFSAKIFGVEIRVGGRGEKILVENNPIKSIKSITPTGRQKRLSLCMTIYRYV
jgi:hypothetical protein